MTLEKLEALLMDTLESLDDSELIDVWNNYCMIRRYGADMITSMDRFDETFDGDAPLDVVRSCWLASHFCPNDNWFSADDLGNIESFDDLSEYNCPIDADILIDYMIQTGDGRGSEKLQSLLDNFLCIDDMD